MLLPLRNLGAYLKANYPTDDGIEGHGRLLAFLSAYLQGERVTVPADAVISVEHERSGKTEEIQLQFRWSTE